jgi:hypothetical protein
MRKLLVIVGLFALTAGVNLGCDKNKSDNDTTAASKSDGTMKMSTDDCAMCPGVQSASTDGKCPKCGMKVKG